MFARLAALALLLAACSPGSNDTDATGTTGATTHDTTGAPTTGATPGDGVHLGPCKPVDGDAGCPGSSICCSDDPATVGGKIPNYYRDGVNDATYGTPIFSDDNNALSHWGFCVDTGELQTPLVNDCPVPCNPRWAPPTLAEICGPGATCCSFTDLDPDKDCVLDGERWRAVTGQDVLDTLSLWGSVHTTNQDPYSDSCKLFVTGVPGQGPVGKEQMEAFVDCIAQLSVADQRGYCVHDAFACPCKEDLCAAKNADYVPRCP